MRQRHASEQLVKQNFAHFTLAEIETAIASASATMQINQSIQSHLCWPNEQRRRLSRTNVCGMSRAHINQVAVLSRSVRAARDRSKRPPVSKCGRLCSDFQRKQREWTHKVHSINLRIDVSIARAKHSQKEFRRRRRRRRSGTHSSECLVVVRLHMCVLCCCCCQLISHTMHTQR